MRAPRRQLPPLPGTSVTTQEASSPPCGLRKPGFSAGAGSPGAPRSKAQVRGAGDGASPGGGACRTPREADLALVACPRKGLTRLVVPPEPRGRPGCGSQGLRALSEPLALQQAHHAGKQARGLWGQAGSGDRCLTGKARLSSQGHKPKVSRGHSLGMSSCQSGQPCT